MAQRITLKMIAENFGVSISTVSKALNNSVEISKDTKNEIQKYASFVKYKPNSIARSLRNSQTKTIGVVVPNIQNNFFSKAFAGIEEVCSANDYTLISCISDDSYEKEVKTIELLKNGALDGIILSIAEETEVRKDFRHLKNVADEGIPLVLFDRVVDNVSCDKIIVDDFDAAYNATRKLIQSGCKHVAVVSKLDALSVGKLRAAGYKSAIKDYNPDQPEMIFSIGKSEDITECLIEVLSTHRIDALLCLEETATLNAVQLLKTLGKRIPEDVSVISFTNNDLQKFLTPAVTTVSQHARKIGMTAATMLIKRLEKKHFGDHQTKVICTSLIERDSTRAFKTF